VPFCCDWKAKRQVNKASHCGIKQQLEITQQDDSIIACSCHMHMGIILHAHPLCDEPHIQCNTNQEVAKVSSEAALTL